MSQLMENNTPYYLVMIYNKGFSAARMMTQPNYEINVTIAN